MSNQVKGFNDLISERKASPLKFAWDKFKDIGAIRSATPVAKAVAKRVVDPTRNRAQEYQELVSKKSTAGLRLVNNPRDSEAKSTEPLWASRVLTAGLHQANPSPRLDLAQPKAVGLNCLFGGL